MVDLGGPKIRLGEFEGEINLVKDSTINIEHQNEELKYPYTDRLTTLPCRFEIHKFISIGKTLLIDDGKVNLEIIDIVEEKVVCKVIIGGIVKSAKSINLPYCNVDIPPLTDRDKSMLMETLSTIKPKYIACSFIKSVQDINLIREYIQYCITKLNTTSYQPKICVKIETHEVLEGNNLEEVIRNADLVMVARGDMALETLPTHILVPMYQDKIVKMCKDLQKPVIVATEALDSMCTKSTPSRAEISDIYRSIFINKADFIMLSGESATGSYPKEAVSIMSQMIDQYSQIQ
jgi:pyruvate kinase